MYKHQWTKILMPLKLNNTVIWNAHSWAQVQKSKFWGLGVSMHNVQKSSFWTSNLREERLGVHDSKIWWATTGVSTVGTNFPGRSTENVRGVIFEIGQILNFKLRSSSTFEESNIWRFGDWCFRQRNQVWEGGKAWKGLLKVLIPSFSTPPNFPSSKGGKDMMPDLLIDYLTSFAINVLLQPCIYILYLLILSLTV